MSVRYSVIGFPTYFLIDPDGKIYKKYVGKIGFDRIKSDVEEINSKYNDIAELRIDK